MPVAVVAAAGALLVTATAALQPLPLARALVAAPSVTPADGGAMAVVADAARAAGFAVEIFEACAGGRCVKNLIGQRGQGSPRLAFAGHVDVVPPGDAARWRHPPFAAEVDGGRLYGRGAADMKGAIAAFLVAAQRQADAGPLQLLITGDEEEGSPEGMRAIMARLQARGTVPDACLIGEASNEGTLGQGIRVGRRGSLNAHIEAEGVQGHVAWPHRARNAAHLLVRYLNVLVAHDLGPAESIFPPTGLQISRIVVPNEATNVIPGRASAHVNVRFNRRYSGVSLGAELTALAAQVSPALSLRLAVSGEPYVSEAPALLTALDAAITESTGARPEHNAGGGVSDGRFLHALCPVLEFGLVGDTAHQVDEHVAVADLERLADIYASTLRRLFGG